MREIVLGVLEGARDVPVVFSGVVGVGKAGVGGITGNWDESRKWIINRKR